MVSTSEEAIVYLKKNSLGSEGGVESIDLIKWMRPHFLDWLMDDKGPQRIRAG